MSPVCRTVRILRALSSSLAVLACALPAGAEELEPAVVVAVGAIEAAPSIAAGADDGGGAVWRLERLVPIEAEPDQPPTAALDRLARHYSEASFLRCLAEVQDPALRPESLLEAHHREAAGLVAVYAAACAHGAGDAELSRTLLRHAAVAELPLEDALSRTTPELQVLAEEVQREVTATARVALRLTTRPARARIWIDGDPSTCRSSPCEVSLRPGRHVIVAETLGYRQRAIHVELVGDETREVSLDRAPAELQREQLARAADAGSVDRPEIAAAAADAFGARVVLLGHREADLVRLALYDRGLQRIVARGSAPDEAEALRLAACSAVREWRGVVEPRPLARRPPFWAILATAVVVVGTSVGLGVWAGTREPEVSHSLVFR